MVSTSHQGQSFHNQKPNVYDSTVLSTNQQAVAQPLISDLDSLNQAGAQMDVSSPGEDVLENVIDDCLQQLSDLQLNKTHDQPEHETFSYDKAIVNLQTELHKAQTEKDVLSDLRMEDLIACLGQEMALLTDKLNSSKSDSLTLSVKLELLKKLAERQTSLHQCHVSELVSTLSSHKDKRCSKQMQCELQEEVKALRRQLEAAREQLRRGGEEKTHLEALLEQRTQEDRISLELLEEKNKELLLRQQDAQQHLAKLEEAQSQCQTLHVDRESLKLKLDDQEKTIDILRLQMESSIQMTAQYSHTIDSLHQENSLLSNQLNQHKLEIQQLRTELDQHKSDLAAADHERRRLQASVVEQSHRVQEETVEKQQLHTQLEVQRTQLLTLTKEHKQLQQLHSCKSEEHKGVVLKLQSQLRNAHDELDQVRSTLRTLEGADGHGLQAALDMQEKITAKREQIDSLQSKVQHLEETMEKLYQEKLYQGLEQQRQLQELTFVREEKRQLGNELEALRSKDKQLRERISQLEAILHKMSESFADCQDFIQLQEQEFFRLKLQHALDLKEFQGQNLHTALNVPSPDLVSTSPSALTAPPASQYASSTQTTPKRQQESPARELRSLVKELRGVISENHRPHTDNSAADSSFHRRRSEPERVHRTTFTPAEVKAGSRPRRKTCGSEPLFLRTAELNGEIIENKSFSESCIISSPATAARYMSSQQLLSLGRKSPVHYLLTSDPRVTDTIQQT
ncbi:Coiled-coil domain-containing protein 158 [Collichthys lucidus]|uniref:Coiled-coil domain-containing protein 158 n=1 Tax=Collichthys lucidus TaxID=240159 RepID=A0A4U5UTF6_COLLU|nr:Coiled-coil domain-containing protein 158 [Collichthys lucidus]